MLANFFGKSNPIHFFVILALFVSYFMVFVFFGEGQLITINFTFYDYLKVLSLLLLGFLIFNFILSKSKLTLENSYAFLIFVVLFGVFPVTMFAVDDLILNFFTLILIRKLLTYRNQNEKLQKLFDSGFWLGVLILLQPFSILYFLLVIIAVTLFYKLTLHNIIIIITGIIPPLLFCFTYWFILDSLENFYKLFWLYTDYDFSWLLDSSVKIPLLIFITITIISLFVKTPKIISISGKYRSFWSLTVSYLALSFLLITLLENKVNGFLLCFFPMTVIITNWLEGLPKRWMKEIFLGFLILLPFMWIII